MGVKPDASHLPDECPRLLDHRGFLICLRSLIQVIHAWPLNCDNQYYLQDVICTLHLHSVTTAHLFCTSVWMVYHHLNPFFEIGTRSIFDLCVLLTDVGIHSSMIYKLIFTNRTHRNMYSKSVNIWGYIFFWHKSSSVGIFVSLLATDGITLILAVH